MEEGCQEGLGGSNSSLGTNPGGEEALLPSSSEKEGEGKEEKTRFPLPKRLSRAQGGLGTEGILCAPAPVTTTG